MTSNPTAVDHGTSAGKPRGPYAKSAEVREKILEACIEVFSESGFHGATMRDIAQRAGISQTGLNHHFPDKADLLVQVLAARARQQEALIGTVSKRDFFDAQLSVIRDNEHRPGMLELHSTISAEATSVDHPAHELYRKRYDDLRQYLTSAFELLREEGDLDSPAPVSALANLFVGALDGLQLQWLYNPAEVDVAGSIEALLWVLIPSRR